MGELSDKRLSARVSEHDYARVEQAAVRERRRISDLIRIAVFEYIEKHQR